MTAKPGSVSMAGPHYPHDEDRMATFEERLRPHPAERFDNPERALDLPAALAALRAEDHPPSNGHRQIALLHHGPVRLVLFAFEREGFIPQHSAPGWVTIHVLRGTILVRTEEAEHTLTAGGLLALAPGLPHDVRAEEESDMLLGIYPDVEGGGAERG